MRKIFFLSILTISVIFSSLIVNAQEDIKVLVNDKQVSFPDVKPFIDENNRTLVPVRFITEELGAKVEWNGEKQEVSITTANEEIKVTIGKDKAVVNGNEIKLDTKPILRQARTFVPLRFIGESLDCEIEWIGESRTIKISTLSNGEKIKEINEVIQNPEDLNIEGITKAQILDSNPYEFSIYENEGTTFIKTNIIVKLALIKDNKVMEISTPYPSGDDKYYPFESNIKGADYLGIYDYNNDTIKLISNPFK